MSRVSHPLSPHGSNMIHLLLLALAPLAAPEPTTAPGTELVYRGELGPKDNDAGNRKTFDLKLWIVAAGEQSAELLWLVEERGPGEMPWPSRFGRLSVERALGANSQGPAVLYDRGDGRTSVNIPLPFFKAREPLAADVTIADGALTSHVDKATKVGEKPAWRISQKDGFGPKRSLTVDQASPVVWSLKEKLTMGRGVEYELKLELVASGAQAGEHLTALVSAFNSLAALVAKLNVPPAAQDITWNDTQLATLREGLSGVSELAVATPLAGFVSAARRDLDVQTGRSDGVAELATKSVGRTVEPFALRGVSEGLSEEGLRGQVTILHFWDYRDEPLKEPYGQVGYLDFMYHRRKTAGLKVFGVAVDGRLADEKTRAASERSVRKLIGFMNLSYPVLYDAGSLIKQFGDPRVVGASLPLFIVVGRDGKILHYHAGTYAVHQDQGLRELDEVVSAALSDK
jgi:hypothetical protein